MNYSNDNAGALKFCFIYGKQHGIALITHEKFERIKEILYGETKET